MHLKIISTRKLTFKISFDISITIILNDSDYYFIILFMYRVLRAIFGYTLSLHLMTQFQLNGTECN